MTTGSQEVARIPPRRARPAVGLVFVSGLVVGALSALGIERLVTPSAREPLDLDVVPGVTPVAPLAARPRDVATPQPGSPSATAGPLASGARATPGPADSPQHRLQSELESALDRGDMSRARALLDRAIAAGLPLDLDDVVSRLPADAVEAWVRAFPDGAGDVIRVLLQDGLPGLGPGRPSSTELGLELLRREVEGRRPVDASNVLRALNASPDRTLALLAASAANDPVVSLAIATWLADNGRADEAIRRVVADTARRAPTADEVAWLTIHDPAAAVRAARAFAERRSNAPRALVALGRALEASGDKGGAFDALASALRSDPRNDDLEPDELVRLDPARASHVLAELYGGRDGGQGATALAKAWFLTGHDAEAGRELVRLSTTARDEWLDDAARLAPEATAAALAPRFADIEATVPSELGALMAYGSALRRSGKTEEAMRVLRVVADRSRDPGSVLVEMLRCDPAESKAFVESQLSRVEPSDFERIRILGLLGRKEEAIAAFERLPGARGNPDLWVALATADTARALDGVQKIAADEQTEGEEPPVDWLIASARILAEAGRTGEARAVWARIPNSKLHDLWWLIERASLR